jgi:hypothetical protein
MILAPNEKPMRPVDIRETAFSQQKRSQTIHSGTKLTDWSMACIAVEKAFSQEYTSLIGPLGRKRPFFVDLWKKKEDVR